LNITRAANDSSGAVATTFTRRMTCAAAEWRRLLDGAVRAAALPMNVSSDHATVDLSSWQDGSFLRLDWQELPERRIALIRLPQMEATFTFHATTAATVQRFMAHFDLHTQRGGG